MPLIVANGTFKVYVYANDHPPPHCHVRWAGSKRAIVDLISLAQTGDRLPRAGKVLIRANRAILLAAWNRFNP